MCPRGAVCPAVRGLFCCCFPSVRDYRALSFLHTVDGFSLAGLAVGLTTLCFCFSRSFLTIIVVTGGKIHEVPTRSCVPVSRLDCVNALARLGQRWLGAFQIFHTSWRLCQAVPLLGARVCVCVRGGDTPHREEQLWSKLQAVNLCGNETMSTRTQH